MSKRNMPNKTQRNIRAALLRLLDGCCLAEISTTMICTEAEISRSTFYAYYDSKYEVLADIENEVITGFLNIMLSLRTIGKETYYGDINRNRKAYFTQYFQYIKDHYPTFKILLNQKSETGFSVRFSRAISKVRLETLQLWHNYPTKGDAEHLCILAYREEALTTLYVTLFSFWCSRGMDLSVEKMADILNEIWKSFSLIGIA